MISARISLRGPSVQRCFLVAALGDEALEHLTLMINRPPEIVFHAVDLHENFVEMPASLPEIPHRLDTTAPDLGLEDGAEPVPPEPHRFVGDIDAALVKQVLHIPQ